MSGRRDLRYDFLQVTDELLDVQCVALAHLLTTAGTPTSPGDALRLVLRLERYVLQKTNPEAADVAAEFRAAATLPRAKAAGMLSRATDWPMDGAGRLLACLSDPEVRVLTPTKGGWVVAGVADRYGRFARRKKAARDRTRNNEIAREAGWAPGEDGIWVHTVTGEVKPSLLHVMTALGVKS